MLYLLSILSGILAVNGLPHFIKGVFGERHQTPFGKGSSALVNIIWGWVNFMVAAVLIHYAHPRAHLYRAFVCFSVGGLVMALGHAYVWSTHPEYNKPKTTR